MPDPFEQVVEAIGKARWTMWDEMPWVNREAEREKIRPDLQAALSTGLLTLVEERPEERYCSECEHPWHRHAAEGCDVGNWYGGCGCQASRPVGHHPEREPSDQEVEYEICKRRGHQPTNEILTSNPPRQRCKWCERTYRYETRLVEGAAPQDREAK